MTLMRAAPTQFGVVSLAKLAAGMWASEELRLWDIAHELSRLSGDLVTPMEVSQAIETINANPAGRWCRSCGKRLTARVSKRAVYCSDECKPEGRRMLQTVRYHREVAAWQATDKRVRLALHRRELGWGGTEGP